MKHAIEGMLGQYEQGRISRRELVAGLTALATAGPARGGTFQALGLNHIAVRVADVKRSRDFYQKHFGMPVLTESASNCFLGIGKDHFVTLFQGQKGELDHYCISIDRFAPDAVMEELKRQGLRPNRPSGTNRIYFPDPDGITVQVSALNHRP
jgi:catechol 2,3-dioxygenase-like lactoylglutathione lyase family enzyme